MNELRSTAYDTQSYKFIKKRRTAPPNREEEENQHHPKGDKEKAPPPKGEEGREHHQKGEANFLPLLLLGGGEFFLSHRSPPFGGASSLRPFWEVIPSSPFFGWRGRSTFRCNERTLKEFLPPAIRCCVVGCWFGWFGGWARLGGECARSFQNKKTNFCPKQKTKQKNPPKKHNNTKTKNTQKHTKNIQKQKHNNEKMNTQKQKNKNQDMKKEFKKPKTETFKNKKKQKTTKNTKCGPQKH